MSTDAIARKPLAVLAVSEEERKAAVSSGQGLTIGFVINDPQAAEERTSHVSVRDCAWDRLLAARLRATPALGEHLSTPLVACRVGVRVGVVPLSLEARLEELRKGPNGGAGLPVGLPYRPIGATGILPPDEARHHEMSRLEAHHELRLRANQARQAFVVLELDARHGPCLVDVQQELPDGSPVGGFLLLLLDGRQMKG